MAEESVLKRPHNLPRVAKGAMINFSGGIIRMVFIYVYALLLTRILDVAEVGQFFLMVTVMNIMATIAAVGLDFGVVRYVALFTGEGNYWQVRRVIRVGLMLGVVIAIIACAVLFSISGILSDLLFESSEVARTGLRVFALAIPMWVAARLLNAATQGLHRMRYQVYSRDIVEQASRLLFTVTAVALGAGLVGVVWANVASIFAAALLSYVFVKVALPNSAGPVLEPKGAISRLLRYSFPLAFSNILMIVVLWIDLLLVGYLGNATEAGYYGVALKVATASAAIMVAFATVFNPIISDVYNRKQRLELQFLYKTVTRWIFTCSLPVIIVLILFSTQIMKFFGEEYAAGGMALALLAFSQLITTGIGTAGLIVLMTGHSRLELINMAVSLVVDVVICILLIPGHGIIGAAIANIAAAATLNILRALETWFLLDIHAYSVGFYKPMMAGATSAAVVILAGRFLIGYQSPAQILSLIAIMMVLYLLVMVMFGLNEQDRDVLKLVGTRFGKAYQEWMPGSDGI